MLLPVGCPLRRASGYLSLTGHSLTGILSETGFTAVTGRATCRSPSPLHNRLSPEATRNELVVAFFPLCYTEGLAFNRIRASFSRSLFKAVILRFFDLRSQPDAIPINTRSAAPSPLDKNSTFIPPQELANSAPISRIGILRLVFFKRFSAKITASISFDNWLSLSSFSGFSIISVRRRGKVQTCSDELNY